MTQANLEGARTQEEFERQEFEAAYECLCLREAYQRAIVMIGKDEAAAIIEQEQQRHKRMH